MQVHGVYWSSLDRLCVCAVQPEAELGDSDSEAGSDANKVSKRKKKLESRLQIAELKQVHLLLSGAVLCCAVQCCAALNQIQHTCSSIPMLCGLLLF